MINIQNNFPPLSDLRQHQALLFLLTLFTTLFSITHYFLQHHILLAYFCT